MHQTTRHTAHRILVATRRVCNKWLCFCLVLMSFVLGGCEREPLLHLHQGGTDAGVVVPNIDLNLKVVWNYLFKYDVTYNWEAEWIYGWDETDQSLYGPIGYTEPQAFDIRRYYTGAEQYGAHTSPYRHTINGHFIQAHYEFGFWDILAWNTINTPDGIQSIHIDEETSLDQVTAYTGPTMHAAHYNASRFPRSFYQPEELFAGYDAGIDINPNLDGFVFDADRNCWVRQLEMELQPVTYIYLVQVILHHNNRNGRKIIAIDGNANLSGMARTVCLNTGVTGTDAITVNFFMRMKQDLRNKAGELVDVIGGKTLTFGLPKLNPSKLNTQAYLESLQKVHDADLNNKHYVDVKMQFYNGKDSTFVFDVTDQVRRLYRGGVITVELDMDKVPVPNRSGGSGFDAVVEDFKEEKWEFDM